MKLFSQGDYVDFNLYKRDWVIINNLNSTLINTNETLAQCEKEKIYYIGLYEETDTLRKEYDLYYGSYFDKVSDLA